MDDVFTSEKPGLFGRLAEMFQRPEYVENDDMPAETREYETTSSVSRMQPCYRYTVTVRRQVSSFEDAMSAANGLKRGESQIVNLTGLDAVTKQKIVDFMSGVNYAQEGTWEEVGTDVYLIAPSHALVEVAPATPKMNAIRN